MLHTAFSLVTTFFLSLGVTLWRESKKAAKFDIFVALLPIMYGAAYYLVSRDFGWDDSEKFVLFFLHLAGFVAVLFVAPYLGKIWNRDIDVIEYTNYFTQIAWTKVMTGIVGVSVMLLGFIAIGSVITLFDLSNIGHTDKLFGYWATIALSLIAPLYGLIHFPELCSLEKKEYEINRFFSFLVRFVGIPFIFLYFAILYTYSGRVMLHFHDWPKGMISWLVVGFSTFGYLIYIFSKPYEGTK